jgi:hypothetical protein
LDHRQQTARPFDASAVMPFIGIDGGPPRRDVWLARLQARERAPEGRESKGTTPTSYFVYILRCADNQPLHRIDQ